MKISRKILKEKIKDILSSNAFEINSDYQNATNFLHYVRKAILILKYDPAIWKPLLDLDLGGSLVHYLESGLASNTTTSNANEILHDFQKRWIDQFLTSGIESTFVDDLYLLFTITGDHKEGYDVSQIKDGMIKSPTILMYLKNINGLEGTAYKVMNRNKVATIEEAKALCIGKTASFTYSTEGVLRMRRYYPNAFIFTVDINRHNLVYRIGSLSQFPEEDEILLNIEEEDILDWSDNDE